ncbi:MAG: efflux RND transporter periplasmic adaptor subunit [Pseudomonadota bacterium]
MQLQRYGSVALVLVLLLAGCQPTGEQSDATDEDEEETPPVPVEVQTPVRGDIYAIYSGTAPIEAFAEADVVAKVNGEVRQLLVEEGDEVAKQQVLARLDGDRLRLELNESRARLDKLRRDFERNEELQEKGLISEGDFERLRYDLEALQASYNLASLELDYTQIRAPIDGVISERYIKIGNTIDTGDPLFRVTSLDPLVAYLYVPEREFRQLKAGQVVLIEIDALTGLPVVAAVSRISPIVDPETGTFKLTIELDNGERRIKPGMFGRMNVVYDRHENALQVPRSAITERGESSFVFVVEDNVATRRSIETGFSHEGMIEITSGLSDGEQVITLGHVGLKNGAAVAIINSKDTD